MKQNISKNRQFLIDRLGVLRTRQKFSARELSLRLGFSVNYINRFESGNFSIPAEVLLEAIEICGSTPEEFFSPDISKFPVHKELITEFDRLMPESKQYILDIMKKLK